MAKFIDYDEQSEKITVKNPGRLVLTVGASIVAIGALWGSWFVVEANERAGVRTFGTVTTTQPLQPGIHFKVPFFSHVDEIQVSQQMVHVSPFIVNTVDNQPIEIDINILYRIPETAVFRLLYGTGIIGRGSINEQVISVTKDRVSRIIASKNTITISANREAIQAEITKHVHDELTTLFGIEMDSFQISGIKYSPAFMESNDRAVRSKNDAVAEENKKKVIEYQAQQRVIAAEGEAREQVARAEGDAKSQIAKSQGAAQSAEINAKAQANARLIAAEAERKALELGGLGEAARLQAVIQAMGGPEKYLESLRINAMTRWNGSVPNTIMNMGQTNGQIPFMMNMPAPK